MLKFAHPDILFFLVLVPVFVVFFYASRHKTRKMLAEYASPEMHGFLFPDVSSVRSTMKFYIMMLALGFTIFALAGPRVGSKLTEVEKKGREIIIALDVSRSMLAQDIEPNRLIRAKQAVSRLLDGFEDDKIGLIIFAGDAYTQVPLTNDYQAAKMFLESIDAEIISKQGTNLAAAIDLGIKSFSPVLTDDEGNVSASSRAIIIITDGENHEPGVFEAAERAMEKGVVVHTVGIGDPSGVPIPVSLGSQEYKKDREGKVVVSKLDEKTLKKISEITKGYYIHSGSAITGLFSLMKRLDELDKKEFKTNVFAEYDEKFQYFAGLALFFLLIEFIIMQKRNQWFDKIKLFD